MILWLIGLSGAGKTTIGREVHRRWKALEPGTVLVDGDSVRRIFAQDRSGADYSVASRRRNGERLLEMCRWLDEEGINVVCCVLSIFPDLQSEARRSFPEYFEVFVDVPVEILAERDDKGLYGPALRGETHNVVGVDIDFPRPANPDLVVDNRGFDTTPDTWAVRILEAAGITAGGARG